MLRRFLFAFLVLPLLSSAREPISNTQAKQFTQHHSLSFIENKGQVTDQSGNSRTDIDFKLSAGKGLNIFIGKAQLHYQWSKTNEARPTPLASLRGVARNEAKQSNPNTAIPGLTTYDSSLTTDMYRLDVELLNANPNAEVITEEQQDYYETYYTPPFDVNKGATVHSYNKITYKNIYPNIDWVLYISNDSNNPLLNTLLNTSLSFGEGRGEALKYDFIIHPGGNPKDIQIKYNGATDLKQNADGSITASNPMGIITEQKPYSFEKESGTPVESNFVLRNNELSFDLAEFHDRDLIIDPTLEWGTYFGGSDEEFGYRAACDVSGNVYMVGYTKSLSNIASSGAYQTVYGGGTTDVFLTKFSSIGAMQWSTYYGGSGIDYAYGITCDANSNVYIVGETSSSSNIATSGACQSSYGGGVYDGFLVKFNGIGIRQWATYYGGGNQDYLSSIVFSKGSLYVLGVTNSNNNIATSNAFQSAPAVSGGQDAFLAKFDTLGSRQWATYYGGIYNEDATQIVADTAGNIYFAGYTSSSNNFATSGSFSDTLEGPSDAYLAKFSSTGNRQWVTYLGGTGSEGAGGLCYDGGSGIYIYGFTTSSNGIATANVYQSTITTNPCPFLAKFNTIGQRLWGTYENTDDLLAYSPNAIVNNITCNARGDIFVTGGTNHTSGVATSGAFQMTMAGIYDVFIEAFNSNGQKEWGTYYGGPTEEFAFGITCDGSGSIYLTGYTGYQIYSNPGPGITTVGAFQTTYGGGVDAFLAKISVDTVVYFSSFIDTSMCVGDTINIPYIANFLFHSGNTFIAQLSDASGSFTSPINVGSLSSNTSGNIHCTIPANMPDGSSYRMRIIASNPIDTSVDDGINIRISHLLNIYNSSNNSPKCIMDILQISVNDSASTVSYTWTGPNAFTANSPNISRYIDNYLDSGNYYLSLNLGACHLSDTFHFIVKPSPVKPAASNNSPFCSYHPLNLSATCTTSGVSYQWTGPNNFSSTQQNPAINPAIVSNAGNYIVSAILNGCAASDTTNVLISQGPDSVYAVYNNPLCTTDTLHLNAGSITSGVSYSWSGPSYSSSSASNNIANVSSANAGNYYLTATLNSCIVHDTLNVTVNPKPAFPLVSSNSAVCEGANLALSSSCTTPGVSYSWTGPNSFTSSLQNPIRNNVIMADTGSYFGMAALGPCSSVSAVHVVIIPPPQHSTITSNSPVCAGDTLKLNASNTNSSVTYSWSGPNTFSSLIYNPMVASTTTTNSGNYILTTTLNNCSVYDTLNATVKPLPANLSFSSNSPLCANTTLNLSVSSTSGSSFSWSGPAGFTSLVYNPSVTNIQSTNAGYYKAIASFNGCIRKDSTLITVKPLPASTSVNCNNPVCQNDSLHLYANSTSSGLSYSWSGPAGFTSTLQSPSIANVQFSNAGNYNIVFSLNGCADTLILPVTVNPALTPPTVSISVSPGDTVCAGTNLTFTAIAGNVGSPAYTWRRNGTIIPATNTPSFTTANLSNGDHITCTINSNFICQHIDTAISNSIHLDLISNPPPVTSLTVYPLTYTLGTLVTFTGHVPTGSTGLTYAWTKNGTFIPGHTTAIYTDNNISPSDVICFIAYSNVPCTIPDSAIACSGATAVTNITSSFDDIKIYPNPFTNELNIRYTSSPLERSGEVSLKIYDIVGREVYRAVINTSPPLERSGEVTVNTTAFAAGTYILDLTDPNGERLIKKIVK